MALCGFNEKMIKGLTMFNEGLVEHGLVYRGKQNGESLEQGIKREISDMFRLKQELHRIEDSPKRVITEGVVTYATGFYLLMRQKGLAESPKKYKRFIAQINKYFQAMDSKFYSELEGKPDDMKDLAVYLNGLDI